MTSKINSLLLLALLVAAAITITAVEAKKEQLVKSKRCKIQTQPVTTISQWNSISSTVAASKSLLVLLTNTGWGESGFCPNCATFVNITLGAAYEVNQELCSVKSQIAADEAEESDSDDDDKNNKNAAKMVGGMQTVIVDCGSLMPGHPNSPCRGISKFPELGMWVNGNENTKSVFTPKGTTEGSVGAVRAWVEKNLDARWLDNTVNIKAKSQLYIGKLQFEESNNRMSTSSSPISRVGRKDIVKELLPVQQQEHDALVLALIYSVDCRTCAPWLQSLEKVASTLRKSLFDAKRLLIHRVPIDAEVKGKWLGENSDVPQLAVWYPPSVNGGKPQGIPVFYHGAPNALAISHFVGYTLNALEVPENPKVTEALVAQDDLMSVQVKSLAKTPLYQDFINVITTQNSGPALQRALLYVENEDDVPPTTTRLSLVFVAGHWTSPMHQVQREFNSFVSVARSFALSRENTNANVNVTFSMLDANSALLLNLAHKDGVFGVDNSFVEMCPSPPCVLYCTASGHKRCGRGHQQFTKHNLYTDSANLRRLIKTFAMGSNLENEDGVSFEMDDTVQSLEGNSVVATFTNLLPWFKMPGGSDDDDEVEGSDNNNNDPMRQEELLEEKIATITRGDEAAYEAKVRALMSQHSEHLLVLFHNMESKLPLVVDASRKAIAVFEKICREFNSSTVASSPLMCGVMDASRFPRLAMEFSSNVIGAENANLKNRPLSESKELKEEHPQNQLMPFIVHMVNVAKDKAAREQSNGGVSISVEGEAEGEEFVTGPDSIGKVKIGFVSFLPRTTMFLNEESVRSELAQALGIQVPPPTNLKELTINSFEKTVNNPEFGTLVLFTGGNGCPHSKEMMPVMTNIAATFARDRREVIIATLDTTTQMDEDMRKYYNVKVVPQIKWFPKHNKGDNRGEKFEGTPFRDSILEFVHDEMGYPFVELDMKQNETSMTLSARNFDEEILLDKNFSHSVIFLYDSQIRDEKKIETVRNVELKFEDTLEFGYGPVSPAQAEDAIERYEKHAAALEERRAARAKEEAEEAQKKAEKVQNDDDDDSYVPSEEDEEAERRQRERGGPLGGAMEFGHRGDEHVKFYKMDGRRFKKILRKYQLHDLTGEEKLPMLLFLPRGEYKMVKYKVFGRDLLPSTTPSSSPTSSTSEEKEKKPAKDASSGDDEEDWYNDVPASLEADPNDNVNLVSDEDAAASDASSSPSSTPNAFTKSRPPPFTEIEISRFILHAINQKKYRNATESSIAQLLNFSKMTVAKDKAAKEYSPVDVLEQNSFREWVGEKGDRVVLFFAKWCSYSSNFMPIYNTIASKFEGDETIKFGKIDVPDNHEVGHAQGIQSFPTVKVYFSGSTYREADQLVGEEFTGDMTIEQDLLTFINQRGTSKVQELDRERMKRERSILELNESNWNSMVVKRQDPIFVEFYAPWCGHCHQVVPALQELGNVYDTSRLKPEHRTRFQRMFVGKIDGTEHKRIASANNVTHTYPVFVLYNVQKDSKGNVISRSHKVYSNHRYIDLFVEFVEKEHPELKSARDMISKAKYQQEMDARGEKSKKKEEAEKKKKAKAKKESDKKKKKKQDEKKRKAKSSKRSVTHENEKFGLKFDRSIEQVDQYGLEKHLGGLNFVLLLSYREGHGDKNALVSTFNDVARTLKPIADRGWITLCAAEIASNAALQKVMGNEPTLAMFRGFANPSQAIFKAINPESVRVPSENKMIIDTDEYEDLKEDDKEMVRRSLIAQQAEAEAGGKGYGGLAANFTHVMNFVEKWFIPGAVSKEIKTDKFDKITQNPDKTVVVMFYAGWSEPCKLASDAYDAQAQVFAHRDDVQIYRADISRIPLIYRRYGEKQLPAIYVFDKLKFATDPKTGKKTKKVPRFFGSEEKPTVGNLKEFISNPDLTPEAISSKKKKEEQAYAELEESVVDTLVELGAVDPKADPDKPMSAGKNVDADDEDTVEMEEENNDDLYKEELRNRGINQFLPLAVRTISQLEKLISIYPVNGVLVFARSGWCVHCDSFLPTLRRVTAALRGRFVVADFLVSKEEEARFQSISGVKVFPSLTVFVNSTVRVFKGAKDFDGMVGFAEKTISEHGSNKLDANIPKYAVFDEKNAVAEKNKTTTGATIAKAQDVLVAKEPTGDNGVGAATPLQEIKSLLAAKQGDIHVVALTTSKSCTKCALMDQQAEVIRNSFQTRNEEVQVVLIDMSSKEGRALARSGFGLTSTPAVGIRCRGADVSGTIKVNAAGTLAHSLRLLALEAAVTLEDKCLTEDASSVGYQMRKGLKKLSDIEGPVHEWSPDETRLKVMNEHSVFTLFVKDKKTCGAKCDAAVEIWKAVSGHLKMNPALKFAVLRMNNGDPEANNEFLREGVGEDSGGEAAHMLPAAVLFPHNSDAVPYRGKMDKKAILEFLDREEERASAGPQ